MIGHSVLVYHGSFDLPLVAAESHLSQVPLLIQTGQPEAALREAETAVALAPQAPSIEAGLGGTLVQMHRMGEAHQAFEQARREAASLSKEELQATEMQIAKMEQP